MRDGALSAHSPTVESDAPSELSDYPRDAVEVWSQAGD